MILLLKVYDRNVFPEGFVHRDKVRTIYEDAGHNLYFIREKGSLFTSTLTMDRFRNRSVFSTLLTIR